jgi:hypothetical protein
MNSPGSRFSNGMNRCFFPLLFCGIAGILPAALANPRASASYRVTADAVSGGAARSTGGSYTNDGSAGGGIVGVSTLAAPSGTAKHGFTGQLSEVTVLQVSAAPANVDETGTRQLAVTALLDDLTSSVVPPSEVLWSVANGPVTSISTGGLATTAPVFRDEPAEVQGSYSGVTGVLGLTVINSLPDNFGSYAGDGIEDGWQFQYFGIDNPDAGPTRDPDGDSQTNGFEFAALLDPTDPDSIFRFRIEPVPGVPASKRLIFSPVRAGRSYEVHATTNLTLPMAPLTGATVSDDGDERTVTDPNAGGAARFYRVHIEIP